jgi:hypothetical protein
MQNFCTPIEFYQNRNFSTEDQINFTMCQPSLFDAQGKFSSNNFPLMQYIIKCKINLLSSQIELEVLYTVKNSSF